MRRCSVLWGAIFEVIEKLDREIDRYGAVAGNNEELEPGAELEVVHQLEDSAFNAAVTAWQIGDWVFNDMPCELRNKLGFRFKILQGINAGLCIFADRPLRHRNIGLSTNTLILRFR
jgi:hypothetical protein